jgi:hypothetical protein
LANRQALTIVCLLLLYATLESCIITKTPGFYSGYKRLDVATQKSIVFMDKESDFLIKRPHDTLIYAINGKQLLHHLKNRDTTLVYFFSPNCGSNVCVPISSMANFCAERGYGLFVIIEYYDDLAITRSSNANRVPLYAINHMYYKTDYCNKYIKMFYKDLLGVAKMSGSGRYLLFNKGEILPFSLTKDYYEVRQ